MLNKILNKLKRIILPWITWKKDVKFENIWKEIDKKKYKKIIIFENQFGFNSIMKQRPQQIAESFPRDVLFIYHSNKDQYENKLNYKFLKENLLLINLDIYRNYFIKKLNHYYDKYLMLYSTNYIKRKIIDRYLQHNFEIIYEYVDNIDEELNGKTLAHKLQEQFDFLVNSSSIHITTTATKLYENVVKVNPNAHVKLITNGVDYDHFKSKKYKVPQDLKEIIEKDKPVIGYYGALAKWFDYELIKRIAKEDKYSIVLLGVDYDQTLEASGLLSLENVYYLGKKEYDVLPRYSAYFDICMIPFLINDITLSTSPVKVFEYMASLKPIVTTALPECMKYESVLSSSNHKEFIDNLNKALSLKEDKSYLELLQKEAKDNTWSSKCKDIITFIKEK